MATLPTGTVTFLFTDIEGSTRLWDEQERCMRTALGRHDRLVRAAIEQYRGVIFKTVGDAFQAAFADGRDAVRAALAIQRAIAATLWETARPLCVRVALHTGAASDERDHDYFGPAVNRVARLRDAGHGGQILLSRTTRALVQYVLPPQTTLRDLREHWLKDLREPEHIFQLVAPDLPQRFAPLRTLGPVVRQGAPHRLHQRTDTGHASLLRPTLPAVSRTVVRAALAA